MKISIITATYNSEIFLKETIISVINQSYRNIEYIIIDGGSTDSTCQIVEEFRDHIDYFVSEPDSGIYDALNKGIELASGEFIGFLHSDDKFLNNDVILNLQKKISNLKNIDGVYGDLNIVKRNDVNKISRKYSSKNFRPWQLRFGYMFPHPTFYVRKHIYHKYGLYKTDYRVSADFELILRYHIAGLNFKRVELKMINMRDGGISSKGIFWKFHQNLEIVRACKENNYFSSILLVLLKFPFKFIEILRK